MSRIKTSEEPFTLHIDRSEKQRHQAYEIARWLDDFHVYGHEIRCVLMHPELRAWFLRDMEASFAFPDQLLRDLYRLAPMVIDHTLEPSVIQALKKVTITEVE